MTDTTDDSGNPTDVFRHYVLNPTQLTVTVNIVNEATGEVAEMYLQPGGKPYLPEGFVPTPAFLFNNPDIKYVVKNMTTGTLV